MSEQRSLFDQPTARSDEVLDAGDWPKAARFPLNYAGTAVRDLVLADLASSRNPLIIAGYASLATIVEFIARSPDSVERIRLLIGSEPTPGSLEDCPARVRPVPTEARECWLGQGLFNPAVSRRGAGHRGH